MSEEEKIERLRKKGLISENGKDKLYDLIVENDKKRLKELEDELDDNIEKFVGLGLSLG